jgi:hypothetical protein
MRTDGKYVNEYSLTILSMFVHKPVYSGRVAIRWPMTVSRHDPYRRYPEGGDARTESRAAL